MGNFSLADRAAWTRYAIGFFSLQQVISGQRFDGYVAG